MSLPYTFEMIDALHAEVKRRDEEIEQNEKIVNYMKETVRQHIDNKFNWDDRTVYGMLVRCLFDEEELQELKGGDK